MTTIHSTRTRATRPQLVAALLATAGLLWTIAYLQHPPGEGVSLVRTMQVVNEHTTAWRWSHLGIAAGYLAAGVAAALTLAWRRPRGLARLGWAALAAASVPLVGYLIVEATIATEAALTGDGAAFNLWYGAVAVWTWRIAWPVFFAGMALVAAAAWRSGAMPRWSCALSVAGAGFGALAPLLAAFGLSGLSLAAFITPLTGWLWLAAFGVGALQRDPVNPGTPS
jgi:hypothetical protein